MVYKLGKLKQIISDVLRICWFTSQGDVERGRQLIHEGIALRRELGVPLYVAAGNCDLGRENSNIFMIYA